MRYEGYVFLKDEFTFPVSWLDSHILITGLYGIGGREEGKTNNKKKYYTLNNL